MSSDWAFNSFSTCHGSLRRHEIAAHDSLALAHDLIEPWCPVSKVFLCIVENLSSLSRVFEGCTSVSWNDGSVIEKVEKTSTVAGENDLLLCSLNGSG